MINQVEFGDVARVFVSEARWPSVSLLTASSAVQVAIFPRTASGLAAMRQLLALLRGALPGVPVDHP